MSVLLNHQGETRHYSVYNKELFRTINDTLTYHYLYRPLYEGKPPAQWPPLETELGRLHHLLVHTGYPTGTGQPFELGLMLVDLYFDPANPDHMPRVKEVLRHYCKVPLAGTPAAAAQMDAPGYLTDPQHPFCYLAAVDYIVECLFSPASLMVASEEERLLIVLTVITDGQGHCLPGVVLSKFPTRWE